MVTAASPYEAVLRFIDEVVIRICAGRGGDGVISFHRAKYQPKGGPDGGDGGRGGDVIIQASSQLWTLEDTTLRGVYRAENGCPGQGGKRSGRAGKDVVLRVPVGTLVWDADNDQLLADITEDKQEFKVAIGGEGGRGNSRFATPRNRTPRKCTPGKPGEEKRIKLELKLLADVGLVGRPNAGKSTMLAALTRARPNIADYPFSTLSPALGIVPYGVYQRFVLADIPGLAEGAGEGRGLGHRFLRHIERTKLLVILIEVPEPDHSQAYNQLMKGLDGYSQELSELPRILVLSKSDLHGDDNMIDFPFDLEVSSVTGDGLDDLVEMIAERLGLKQEAGN